MSINDGGPAFPRDYCSDQFGMTLRDYFAAKAMASFIASDTINNLIRARVSGTTLQGFDVLADMAYVQADAMLKAREQ